ncbi:hypothetical protein GGR59_001702 [Xanthomonas arboricola]|uniref:hypothetical protein n=1 Tax=Xanthomonas arboricola TaxID=56448 RepID=UPI00160D9E1E|nr:hypothetical protein [Xanthomonas arboricola]MBB4605457.1 hypothetical protein [Xanthomonas arboricola]
MIRTLQANNEGDRSDAVAFCVQGVGIQQETASIRERHVEACPSTDAANPAALELQRSSSDSNLGGGTWRDAASGTRTLIRR